MRSSKILNAAGVLAAVLLASLGPAQAKDVWKVEKKLEGEPHKKDPTDIRHAQDVSGIACNSETGFPRQCIVIDDELQRAQVVILHDGEIVAGQAIQLISHSYNGKPLELDGEGVAYDGGYFYVIGSHGSARDPAMAEEKRQARITASSQLLRFRIDGDNITKDGRLKETPRIEATAKLRQALRNNSELQSEAEQKLGENGLTIEGVAVRNGRLHAGLRAPSRDGKAAVASVDVTELFDGEVSVPRLTVDWLTVGKDNGIRDLVRYKDGFIILVGPSGDLKVGDPGKYFVVRWSGKGDVEGPRTDVEVFPGKPKEDKEEGFLKPEAILPLDEDKNGVRLLVMCDGAKEGRPRTMTMR